MKTLKKLMASVLALVMILSCTALASATELQDVDSSGNLVVTPAPTPVTPNLKTTVKSIMKSEIQADDVIKALMPTVTADMFNMYLDPHGLVAKSQTASTNRRFGEETTVASETNVYFHTASGDTNSYTNKSAPLTVGNKSNVPLVVSLDLIVDKGNKDFEFVDTQAKLKEEDRTKASMFLSVTDNAGDNAVTEIVKDSTYGKPTIELPSATVTAGYFLVTPVFEWAADASDTLKAGLNDAFKDSNAHIQLYVKSAGGAPYAYVQSAGADLLAAGKGYSIANTETKIDGSYGAIEITGTEGTKNPTVAYIKFYLNNNKVTDGAVANGNNDATGVAVNFTKWDGKSRAELVSTIENSAAAYELQYGTAAHPTGYEWVMGEVENDALPKKVFQIEGGINAGDMWDDMTVADTIGLDVVWNIRGYVEQKDPVIEVTKLAPKANENTEFKVISLGKSMNGLSATSKGPAVALALISYVDGTKTVSVPVSNSGNLTLKGDVYSLKIDSKITNLGAVNCVFVYENGATVSVPTTVYVAPASSGT